MDILEAAAIQYTLKHYPGNQDVSTGSLENDSNYLIQL